MARRARGRKRGGRPLTYYPPITGEERERLKRAIDRETRRRLARQGAARTGSPGRARAFLLDALDEGPRARAELVAEARALGISEWALGKAKASLGVEHDRGVPNRCGTTWRLPGWREGE